jgi:hypothetical protein
VGGLGVSEGLGKRLRESERELVEERGVALAATSS